MDYVYVIAFDRVICYVFFVDRLHNDKMEENIKRENGINNKNVLEGI